MLEAQPLRLRDHTGRSFAFDAGSASLAFAHTGGAGWRSRYETLRAPTDLVAHVATTFGLELAPFGDDALDDALRLRAAIWACVDARLATQSFEPWAVGVINEAAARAGLVAALRSDGHASIVEPVPVHNFLASVAADAVGVLDAARRDRLRECASEDCYLVFLDTSRSSNRSWCSMRRCGNRAKVATFRQSRPRKE